MSTSALEFSNVSKRFGSVNALAELSFTVSEGETVALLGPNGAGKSTAISLLLGLRAATSGAVRVRGVSPREACAHGAIGAMLQETTLPSGVRVCELIEAYRAFYPRPLPPAEIAARASVEAIMARRLERLSGGERRRVLFALAIAGDPRILFLDEPTVGMDADSRLSFWAQVDELARSGRTILFTTHYLEEADSHARRVLFLQHGRLLADGRPDELRRSSGRHVSFRTTGEWLPRLTTLLPETSLRVDGLTVSLNTEDSDSVVRTIVQSGVSMQNLEVGTVSLETALRQLEQEVPVQ